ncbi:MAG TPA: 3-deoxy-7-phosphoheptulonate synthase [Chitinispirillaceae bacterium]|nr:3-deoxy-7-phosphoheptulonate synthase [Chitinispirillaceae bacterium]
MSFTMIRKLPSVEDVKSSESLSTQLSAVKKQRDTEIRDIIENKNNRFIVVIGPCSAHDENAVCEYINRLAMVQEKVKEKVLLIPRIYTNKPRTTGQGYKGMAHQPDPSKGPNLSEGIRMIRKMHVRALSESHLTSADEMLYPSMYPYLDDLLSYVAVGARSVENQSHRLTCSGLDIPVGMKNPTSGDMKVALNSIFASQNSHVFSYNGWEVKTDGNQHTHLILRGAVDHYGHNIPNYHYEDLISIAEEYQKRKLSYPAIFVDTNHENSGRHYKEQPRISMDILRYRKYSSSLNSIVKGLMIESYLEEGNQKENENVFGKSITDPCLGWDDSEKLIYDIAENC